MGKAIITANNGDGWYTVDEVYDNRWGKETYNRLTDEIITFTNSKSILESQKAPLIGRLEAVTDEINTAIANGNDTKLLIEEQNILIAKIQRINHDIAVLQTQINNAYFQLQDLSPDDEIYVSILAWSADYNDAIPLSTVVGIVDRKRTDQAKNFITIKPTFRDGGIDGYLWDEATDGTLFQKYGQPSSGWSWNYSMADGYDTWEPRYIYADIHTIDYDNDTCEILLDDFFAQSIAPYGLDSVLPMSASIQYMDCNALAFIVGDAVVVDVSDKDNFVVIGFQQLPKPCPQKYYLDMKTVGIRTAQSGSNRDQTAVGCNGSTDPSLVIDFDEPIVPFIFELFTNGANMEIVVPNLGGVSFFEDVVAQPDFIWNSVTETIPGKYFKPVSFPPPIKNVNVYTFITPKSTTGGTCSTPIPGHTYYLYVDDYIPEQTQAVVIPPLTAVGVTTGWTYDIYGYVPFGSSDAALRFTAIPRI